MVGKTQQIAIRLEPELIEQADRIAARIGKSGGLGIEPSRSAVIRVALAKGLAAMEAEQDKRSRR